MTLTTRYYGLVDEDGFITQSIMREEDDELESTPFARGQDYRLLPSKPGWSARPSPTSKLQYLGADVAPEWVETALLANLVAEGLDAVDTTADQARATVLVKQTQDIEYTFAERDARAYREAGYTGTPGRGVSGWAAAKHRDNWTARDAADDILGVADRWGNLLYDIRDLRLVTKEDIRHAADGGEIAAIVANFKIDLAAAMQGAA